MKQAILPVVLLVFLTQMSLAQTLQQVTDNGSTTNNNMTIQGLYIGTKGQTGQTIVGAGAGSDHQNADQQTAIGYKAGEADTGRYQTAVGIKAGQYNKSNQQSAFGYEAGVYNEGRHQLAIGAKAGQKNVGDYQIAIGGSAGDTNRAEHQVAIGNSAGKENSGNGQVAIGRAAGLNNGAMFQTAIGYYAGRSDTGSYKVAIGYYAGDENRGHQQVAIGYYAGRENEGDNTIFIGKRAGYGNTLDNRLEIKHHDANQIPIIAGDLSTNQLELGGYTDADFLMTTGTIVQSGDWSTVNLSEFNNDLGISSHWTKTGNNINYDGGNVGIGIPTPTHLLEVAGTGYITDLSTASLRVGNEAIPAGYVAVIDGKLAAKGIRVDENGNWGDYVFKENYNLMSLDEVEDYISENSHLPQIPSAETIESEGIDLGEITNKQMVKIEELTLYLIEMNKQVAQLKREVIELKQENQLLKN